MVPPLLTPWDPANEQHLAFVIRLRNTPAFVAVAGDSGIHTPEAARAHLELRREHFTKHGFDSCLVSLKETGEPIGSVGVAYHGAHTLPDVGFVFLDEVHGKGYATEAARAMIDHVRENHNVKHVLGFTSPSNTQSRRALERLGLVHRGTMVLEAFLDRGDGSGETAVYAPGDVGDLAAYGVVDISGTR